MPYKFQTEQGLIAIGSGGFFGLGFGKSIQKFGYLPEVEGDFIFSVISEELGFLGILFLVSLYLYIGWRGFLIAEATADLFGKYVATGITTLILSQAFINIGVNLNILPLTGITLPFISYGGSSLLSLMLAIGVLLNISRTADFSKVENKIGLFRRNKVR
ncbi:MAG: FtsW/RodA/SpoVE family cell cycle protein [Candidatus Gracilibacteria bacterium]